MLRLKGRAAGSNAQLWKKTTAWQPRPLLFAFASSSSATSSYCYARPQQRTFVSATLEAQLEGKTTEEVELSKKQGKNKPLYRGQVKQRADAVVIGGGIMGASMLYHLTEAGLRDSVLIEKTELTSGSTWHAAGLTTFYHGGANLRFFHYDSLCLYPQLEKETGQEMNFHGPGSIRLMESKERMDECLYQHGKSKLWPAKIHLVTPKQIKELHPLVNTEGIEGGLWTENDGHIDPSSVTTALAMAAKARGAEIYKPLEVVALHPRADGKWEVVTGRAGGGEEEQRSIIADRIINCGGLWGDKVGKMAGITIPVVPIQHQYVIVKPLQAVIDYQNRTGHQLPVLRDLKGSYYVRQERDGLLVGPYENAKAMRICDQWLKSGVPSDFGMELFEGDLERIMPHVEQAMNLLPCIAEGGITSIINGPISWPADGNPMLGPRRGLKNYWEACGLSYGIAHAGGAGKYLTHWITKGEPPYELSEADPERYGEWATKHFVMTKVRETYGMNNIIGYPEEERPAARPVKIGALYQALKEKGAEFGFHNGFETPNWFTRTPEERAKPYQPSFRRTNWFKPVAEECRHVREKVGVIDVSAFSKFMIKGKRAAEFLEYMCANTMPKVGRSNISHMLTPSGKLYAELTVSRLSEEEFYVVSGSNVERHDLRWLEAHLDASSSFRDGVLIENVTNRYNVLSIVGPRARQVMHKLVLDGRTSVEDDQWKFLDNRRVEVGPSPSISIRVSFTGELGWEIHHPAEYSLPLYNAIVEAGKEFGIVDFGSYALNSFRLEKGFRLLGVDMTKDHNALEAGLEPRFVKLNKAADFIGKAALTKIKQEGVKKRAVCLIVDASDNDAHGNEPLWLQDEIVGFTTSGGYGHTLQKSIAYGYLKTELAVPGTQVEVELLGERRRATVAQEPLVETEPVRTRKAAATQK
ncbi:Dimethylglycine dehydrogenase [Balamuthia mandrillaris]